LYQEGAEGLSVLMGLRNAGHKFMPNHMVFPGGGADEADFGAPVAAALPAPALQRLQRGASPELAAALAHAAARELLEETGLSLGSPPDLAGLDYLCRAETPPFMPIRFNARFFLGPAHLARGALAGSGELEMLDWYPVARLQQLDVPPITRLVLEKLVEWLALDQAGRDARSAMVFRLPHWSEE
jgi:8-oxo-dGTP pyrophosphatase MutT (NUDIX family)